MNPMSYMARRGVVGAAAFIAAAVCMPAVAADPVLGQSKFSQNCASCHSVASTTVVDRGRNNAAMIRNAISNIPAMTGAVGGRLTEADLADIAAYLGNAPTTLSFAQTTVGQSSATSAVTVSASRLAPLSSFNAVASGDFALQGGNCGATVPAGTSCTVGVVFRPTAGGSRTGVLTLSHDGLSSTVPIPLTGSASAALQAGLSSDASSLAFGAQAIGSTSPARTVTLSNSGTAPLDFTSLAVSGVNAGDFARAGSCAVGTPLAVGASCTVTTAFTPAAAGSRTARLDIAASAPTANGTASVSVALSGTGQSGPAAAATPSSTSLSFGNTRVGTTSAAQSITVTSTGSATWVPASITASAPFTASHNCGSGLAPAATCVISVSFTPTGAGAASSTLTLSSNSASSPQTVALSGSGTLTGTAVLAWSGGTSADFGTVGVGSDGGLRRFTLNNTGAAAVTLTSFGLTGDASADYRVDAASTCTAGRVVAVGASCELAVGFTPRATGNRTAALTIAADNATLPAPLALTGVGRGGAQPPLQLSASTLDLSAGTTSSQSLTLTNGGNGVLRVSTTSFSSDRFQLEAPSSNGCGTAPFSLQPGASCQLVVRWLGGATPVTATLTLQGDMSPPTAVVTLNATPGPSAASAPSNSGGGGCTLGAGTAAVDPLLLLMAGLSAWVLWRRRRAHSPLSSR